MPVLKHGLAIVIVWQAMNLPNPSQVSHAFCFTALMHAQVAGRIYHALYFPPLMLRWQAKSDALIIPFPHAQVAG